MGTQRTSFSIEPISTCATLSHTTFHNERIKGDKTGSNIDTRRLKFNQTLYGDEHADLWKNIAEKVSGREYTDEEFYNSKGKSKITKQKMHYEDGRKLRKDAILAFECKTHYPGEMKWAKIENGEIVYLKDTEMPNPNEPDCHFQWVADEEKLNQWVEATKQFILDRFGEQNTEQIILHMDESTPHIHAVITPISKDKNGHNRLSMTKLVNGPKDCAKLQTEYAKAVSHLGFSRGKEYSQEINIGLNRARHNMTKHLDEKLPDDKELADEMYEAALTKIDALEIKLENKRASAEIQSKLRKEKDEKKIELQKLQKENHSLKQQLQLLEIEKQGMRELYKKNPDLYEDMVETRKAVIEMGEEYYKNVHILDNEKQFEEKDINDYLNGDIDSTLIE